MAAYFSIFLVAITVFTGVVWLVNKFYLAPQRQANLESAQSQCEGDLPEDVVNGILAPSGFVDTSVQIFPVIAFVMILRSFLYEPFQIPSDSMMPTLLDGDFILVNKYEYGLRDPVARNKFYENGAPQRGDIVVFKYPVNPNLDYIKRVVGLPGDRIIYRDKVLYIKRACQAQDKECPNFEQMPLTFIERGTYSDGFNELTRYAEQLGDVNHEILVNEGLRPRVPHYFQQTGTQADEFVVPKGHYFAIGDNRDNSLDGRFWGFVPEENLVGKAVFIWMSFDFERTEEDFLPTWIPTGIRFERLGGIG
ncbi:signal peptidase I [Thalassotalea sp. LPB0316]|uniref:signal peptidase I n=1 Tax=Thalassotalea sp. LPB0316 TaxID=2769490 RepID=UPI0018690412|nr:signal peptidase I [Thalassotalea sp. LPB0316]QOL25582.1 signal peptidase I [Thalassotalea sp. LPB0316]